MYPHAVRNNSQGLSQLPPPSLASPAPRPREHSATCRRRHAGAVGAAEAFGAAEVIEAAGVIEAATCLLFVFVPFLVDESVELDLRNEEDPLVFLDTARYAMDKSRTSLVIEII